MAYSGMYTTEVLQTLHPGGTGLHVLEWHVYYYHKSLPEEILHLHNRVIEVFLEVS